MVARLKVVGVVGLAIVAVYFFMSWRIAMLDAALDSAEAQIRVERYETNVSIFEERYKARKYLEEIIKDDEANDSVGVHRIRF